MRRVVEIVAPSGVVTAGVIEASPIFASHEGALVATGSYPSRVTKFRMAGLDPVQVLGGPRS